MSTSKQKTNQQSSTSVAPRAERRDRQKLRVLQTAEAESDLRAAASCTARDRANLTGLVLGCIEAKLRK